MRQPPQQIIYQMQTQRQNLTTELNDELQRKLDSTQTLEDTMNLLSPTLSGSETLQVFMHMSRSLQTYSMCGDPIYGVVSPTSLMSWDELQHEFRRHEKHSVLIENLSPEIPNLPLNVLSSLYAQLSKFGQPLTSPVMHQLHCLLKRSMFDLDLFSITDFVDGHINSDGHLKTGAEQIFKNYNRKLTVLSSNMLQGFLWRYDEFVQSLTSAEEVEALAFCSSFAPHVVSDKKLQNFIDKVLDLIHSGHLDPAKASTEEELQIILNSLLRVVTIKLKKKSHFLLESQTIEEIIGKFKGYVGNLRPVQKLMLGRVLLRNVVPGPIFNEVFFSLKDDFLSNKVDSTVSRVEVLYLLTRLEVFNPQHQLFSAELEKHLEDCHVDIANGNYSSILEELEQNDIFKEAFKALENDMPALAKLCAQQYFYYILGREDLSKEIVQLFIKDIEANPIARTKTFLDQLKFITLHFSKHGKIYEVPHLIWERLSDLVPQFNVRQLSELSFFVKSISTPIRFKIENALIQRFFELLKFEDLGVLRIDSSLELFQVYAHVVHYLDDPQKEEVMESNFGQTMLQSSLTPSTDVLVSLARLQMLSIKYSRHEFEELNHFVFENITKVDGHASMLRRFAVNYRNMRPNYSKEVEENFWTHIANALERDFDTLSYSDVLTLANFLAEYKCLTPELIVKIFNNEFIEKMKAYGTVQVYRSNSHYSNHNETNLANLNQVLCVTYPQYNIPWFNENRKRREFSKPIKVDSEIYETLKTMFGEKFVRINVASPFWHLMNFELCFDKECSEFLPIGDNFGKFCEKSDDNPIEIKVRKTKLNADKSTERIAVVFYTGIDYTSNTKKLMGYRWRDVNCLKLEGYKVVLIDYYDWNKMSMRDNASKQNYIRTLFEEQGIKVNNKNKNSSNLAKTKSAQKLYQGSPLPENHNVLT